MLLTFEGIEGAGKSTQVARLATRLERAGLDVVRTREPGGTELGRRLRTLLLAPSAPAMHPWAELLLYVADRAQHVTEVIDPALARGAIVLCDRFVDASLAYQGSGRGLDEAALRALHAHPPLDRRPARTVLLDLPVSEGLARARRRDLERGHADEGRFEAERTEFHERVRRGYLALAAADPVRVRVVDACAPGEVVERRIAAALADLLPALAEPG